MKLKMPTRSEVIKSLVFVIVMVPLGVILALILDWALTNAEVAIGFIIPTLALVVAFIITPVLGWIFTDRGGCN